MTAQTARRSRFLIAVTATLFIALALIPPIALATEEAAVPAEPKTGKTDEAAAKKKGADDNQKTTQATDSETKKTAAAEAEKTAEPGEAPAPGFNTLEDIYPAPWVSWSDEIDGVTPVSPSRADP